MIVKPETIMTGISTSQPRMRVKETEYIRSRKALGYPLTVVELDTLKLAADGLSSPEIGKKLHVSTDAVKSRLRAIYIKLGASDRAHAVHLAHRKGVIT